MKRAGIIAHLAILTAGFSAAGTPKLLLELGVTCTKDEAQDLAQDYQFRAPSSCQIDSPADYFQLTYLRLAFR